MSNNQLYPYDNLNNRNNNHVSSIPSDHYLVSQVVTTYEKQQTYKTSFNTLSKNSYHNNNKQKNSYHNNNKQKNSYHNNNKQKNSYHNNNKQKNKNNHEIEVKSPKNNGSNYLIVNTYPNTEIISIHKDIYNEYYEDINKLIGRIEYHMKKGNINSLKSFWTDILNKFNSIYNSYNTNNGRVNQHIMISTIKKIGDNLTYLIKQK
jgi:hypothetical protein